MLCRSGHHKAAYRRTAAYIGWHARRRPQQAAILRNGAPISYATLDRDLRAMTQALRALNPAPGQIAAIGHDDLYIQLLLVFSFESLGVITGSLRPGEGVPCHGLLANADLVMLPPDAQPPPCRRLFRLTEGWISSALATPVTTAAVQPAAAADGLSVFRSSGTTGQPKLMLVTYGMMEPRLARQREAVLGLGLNSRSRFLAALHFSVGSMLMSAINCFRLGATFMVNTVDSLAQALVKDQPTHITLLPYQLRRLLATLPLPGATGPLLPQLTVQTIGAKVPETLRRQTLQHLAGRLQENYGSNEVGGIGTVHDQGLLTLQADIDVQISDWHGARLPDGAVGLVRVRSPSLIDSYFHDPKATAAMFRDGWFYPGDLARFVAGNRLQLVGRRSDVLNLGGRKVASAEMESLILASLPTLRDVAVLQRNDGTVSPAVVCVVVDGKLDLPSMAAIIKPIIGFAFVVQRIRQIPRNDNGKIRRLALHDMMFGGTPVQQSTPDTSTPAELEQRISCSFVTTKAWQ